MLIPGVVNLEDKSGMNTETNMTLEEAASGVRSTRKGLKRKKSMAEDVEKYMSYLHLWRLETTTPSGLSMIPMFDRGRHAYLQGRHHSFNSGKLHCPNHLRNL